MKWFKHFTDWRTDRHIVEAERVLNLPGYRFFLSLKEVYGEHFNELDERGYLRYNYRILKEKLQISERKVKKLLEFFKEKERLDYEMAGEEIRVRIPEFIRLADNWEQRRNKDFVDKISTIRIAEERRREEKEDEKKEEEEEENIFRTGKEILDDLNAKAKKKFTDTAFIVQQLRSGKKAEDFSTIIENKTKDEFFLKNPKLLNPRTLFGDEHFDLYLNERVMPDEEEKGNDAAGDTKEDIPYETLCAVYKMYLDTELAAAQDALRYIIDTYDGDAVFEGFELDEMLERISAVSLEEKIVLFTEKTPGLEERRFWNYLEEVTGKDCVLLNTVPEDFLKSEFYEMYKKKLMEGNPLTL